jgi:hypothetical protein
MMMAEALFDFDQWARLARRDPAAFEARRMAMIERIIESADDDQRRRLRGLQFRIDMERRRARNPMDACMRLNRMMASYFEEHFHPALLSPLTSLERGRDTIPDNVVSLRTPTR